MSLISAVFSFPYFPAEVIDPSVDPEDIPAAVFENRTASETQNMVRGNRAWLVRFFDAQASFGWIPRSRLDMLGENDRLSCDWILAQAHRGIAVDQMYLAVGNFTGEMDKLMSAGEGKEREGQVERVQDFTPEEGLQKGVSASPAAELEVY